MFSDDEEGPAVPDARSAPTPNERGCRGRFGATPPRSRSRSPVPHPSARTPPRVPDPAPTATAAAAALNEFEVQKLEEAAARILEEHLRANSRLQLTLTIDNVILSCVHNCHGGS
jgi:hypothetical protein